jgi:hypothetical protein
MQSQFDVTAMSAAVPPAPEAPSTATEILRQILEVQKQHLAQFQANIAAHDASARWRALVARWQQEFPGLPAGCRQILPVLERAYGFLLHTIIEELSQQGDDALDTDFALQDFIDRNGMRLAQLGNLLSLVAPLADAAAQNEAAKE